MRLMKFFVYIKIILKIICGQTYSSYIYNVFKFN